MNENSKEDEKAAGGGLERTCQAVILGEKRKIVVEMMNDTND